MKSFLQIKPKDHHYNLIFLLNGKGASYSDRDRNKTVLCKPNIHLSSALLALTAELSVVSVCFLPAEMDVSTEIPLFGICCQQCPDPDASGGGEPLPGPNLVCNTALS